LSQKYDVVIDEQDPDLLFFSVDFSRAKQRDKYRNHRCKKIFFTGENVAPNLDSDLDIESGRYSIGKCDFSFSFKNLDSKKNYRLPLWILFIDWFKTKQSTNRDPSYLIPIENLFNRSFASKNKFCNFVFSNNQGSRADIFNSISEYKHIDSCGRLLNNSNFNIKGRGDEKYKIQFLRDYKFTIASENSKDDGYTTEKIIHPLSVGSVPIYWGSDLVHLDFNNNSFINVDDFVSYEDLVYIIKEIDENDLLYKKIVQQPVFNNNQIPDFALPTNVLKYFEETIL
jgi:hypothetical protein